MRRDGPGEATNTRIDLRRNAAGRRACLSQSALRVGAYPLQPSATMAQPVLPISFRHRVAAVYVTTGFVVGVASGWSRRGRRPCPSAARGEAARRIGRPKTTKAKQNVA